IATALLLVSRPERTPDMEELLLVVWAALGEVAHRVRQMFRGMASNASDPEIRENIKIIRSWMPAREKLLQQLRDEGHLPERRWTLDAATDRERPHVAVMWVHRHNPRAHGDKGVITYARRALSEAADQVAVWVQNIERDLQSDAPAIVEKAAKDANEVEGWQLSHQQYVLLLQKEGFLPSAPEKKQSTKRRDGGRER
ncbi:hypothetical protein ACFONL_23235, partial [Camelimonas fluminis]